MFWRFGGYANISTLDSILDKPDFTLEEILDDADLIQELKQHNTKLIEYLRDEDVLRRLFEYVIAPPIEVPDFNGPDDDEEGEDESESSRNTFGGMRSLSLSRAKDVKTRKQEEIEELDKQEKNRAKYAFAACEILSSEIWSIVEAMLEAKEPLKLFWSFLERNAPLDPVTAGYFSKIVDPLLDKKTAEMLDFIKSYGNFVELVLKHIDTPNIMDVLLKIISVDRLEEGAGIIEWLHDQNLMPSILAFIGPRHPTSSQIAAGDLLKAIVTLSANASQNEQQCIGPNSLTRQLVSEQCVSILISDMLEGGNPLTVGVGVVIEVIRKNNSDYDPEVSGGPETPPSSSDPIYLGTLLRLFADNVPKFTALLTDHKYTLDAYESSGGTKGRALKAAFGKTIEPLGFDRFKTCELMAELLHCSNMALLNKQGSDAFIKQKDQERAELRSEGRLARARSLTNGDEQYTFKDGVETQSPGEGRKLEVTNSAEDDGFEELGTSTELQERSNEKDEDALEDLSSTIQPIRPSGSRLSLDDEFYDEPLTSPNLHPVSNTEKDTVASLSVAKDAKGATGGTEWPGQNAEKSTSEQLVDAIESQLGPGSPQNEPPPLPERQPELQTGLTPAEPGQGSSARGSSPHPEDKPAPLFAGKTSAENSPSEAVSKSSWTEIETSESAVADASEVQTEELQQITHPSQLEKDLDGRPLVGDHLKMMFVEHKVIPTILDFFFRFPWNNFLHNVVYDVVQQVFNGPMDHGYNKFLAVDLFETGKITERIIEGQLRSDEAQMQQHMRLGYMGHLTLIAEEVVKFSERQPPDTISDQVIGMMNAKVWTDYVDNTLAETRDRDNAILGGVRPDVGGPRQAVLNAVNSGGFSGSSGISNASLSGGDELADSNGGAGFAGGSSLLSGFGSSSDEEDEDMEEIGEPEEGGPRNDQYLAYTPSSLSALSIFSPTKDGVDGGEGSDEAAAGEGGNIPPPLNIPPSRARRQLAARLARHNNNTTSGEEESTSPGLSVDAATSLSAAFNSFQLSSSENDDADPWATVQEPAENASQDNNGDWTDSAQRHPQRSGSTGEWEEFEGQGKSSGDDDNDDDDDDEGEDVPIRLSLGDQPRHARRSSLQDGSELGPVGESDESSGSETEHDTRGFKTA